MIKTKKREMLECVCNECNFHWMTSVKVVEVQCPYCKQKMNVKVVNNA